jgi:hypothetical protein
MPGSVTIKINELVTIGVPDLIHTWARTAAWMEVKYYAPDCTIYPAQIAMMNRLGKVGLAYWVKFYNQKDKKCTVVEDVSGLEMVSQPGIVVRAVSVFIREKMLHGRITEDSRLRAG